MDHEDNAPPPPQAYPQQGNPLVAPPGSQSDTSHVSIIVPAVQRPTFAVDKSPFEDPDYMSVRGSTPPDNGRPGGSGHAPQDQIPRRSRTADTYLPPSRRSVIDDLVPHVGKKRESVREESSVDVVLI